MSRYKCLLLIFFVNSVYSEYIFNRLNTRQDLCQILCNENYFLLQRFEENYIICQRGCRFFNMIDVSQHNSDLNKTRTECYESCNAAYKVANFNTCVLGCDEMEKKETLKRATGFYVFEKEPLDTIMLIQPDIEQMEVEIISEHGTNTHDNLEYNVQYKIPETHIRTMPINAASDNFGIPSEYEMKPRGDWLDCASHNSGIPRFVLLSAIVMAALIGLWLMFATERRESLPDTDTAILGPGLPPYKEPPPQYTLHTEKV